MTLTQTVLNRLATSPLASRLLADVEAERATRRQALAAELRARRTAADKQAATAAAATAKARAAFESARLAAEDAHRAHTKAAVEERSVTTTAARDLARIESELRALAPDALDELIAEIDQLLQERRDAASVSGKHDREGLARLAEARDAASALAVDPDVVDFAEALASIRATLPQAVTA
ncbi:MAG: hypothetical protein IT301_17305 [Dehalococcoidia bacterium]|nr:hypothetical protein [Dehalococcoidia bacterium]